VTYYLLKARDTKKDLMCSHRVTSFFHQSIMINFTSFAAFTRKQWQRLVFFAFGCAVIVFLCFGSRPSNQLHPYVQPIKADKGPPFRGRRCSSSEISWLVSQAPIANSNCPLQTSWMQTFLEVSYSNKDAVLISIGCNRGDDLLNIMRLWSRNASYAYNAVETEYNTLFQSGRACPFPADIDPPVSNPRPAQAFCVEAMSSTSKAVYDIFQRQHWDSTIHVIHAAVSSARGEAWFPSSFIGQETMGLNEEGEMGHDLVPVITVDELVKEHKLSRVDVLSIDTEGNDAKVLLGAVHTLPLVRFLEFEYHHIGHWGQSDLQLIAELLDQFGFDCYWQGNKGQLWRLTGCWDDSFYSKRDWSNIACVKRKERGFHAVMEAIARRHLHPPHHTASAGGAWT
jgi:FkbM family methyltransferase